MDTVPPDGELRPVVDDGIVRNEGGTILGADNKAAIVAMLEGVRRVLAEGMPHAGIELLLTPKEEVGLVGANAFDHDRLHAQAATSTTRRPDRRGDPRRTLVAVARGALPRPRLALGMFPEEGRSAIQAAAKAIADLRLGRVDELTTANVGVISGGTGGNIVPEWCSFLAEARATTRRLADVVQEMLDVFSFAATAADCEVETKVRKSYTGYRLKRDDRGAVGRGCARTPRLTVSYALSGGGADANVFNERGRRCLNLANAMTDIHTPDERISVADLEAMVDVTMTLIEEALA